MPPACTLCDCPDTQLFATAHGRSYFDCPTCRLVFLDPAQRLTPDAERAHYLTHENNPLDTRYRDFLDRLALPLIDKLTAGAEGIDIGSGPGPTLSRMLTERGFPTAIYDPYFAPNPSVFDRTYDFVTATEVVEHFYEPGIEFVRLDNLLRPGGVLGLMTEMVQDERAFDKWHYPRDPTHVSFYRVATMEWIAARFDYALEIPRRNVVVMGKRKSVDDVPSYLS